MNLLTIIDDIRPEKLGSISYNEYLMNLIETLNKLVQLDDLNFLSLIKIVKELKPCYKRDLLIEVLDHIIFSDKQLFPHIFSNFATKSKGNLWKDLANSIISLPDLIANCKMLKKFNRFKRNIFYNFILDKLHDAIKIHVLKSETSNEQKWFYLMVLGRIAISGHSEIVWEKIIKRTFESDNKKFMKLMREILTIPLQVDNNISRQFEIFIEPLILPIFFYQKPIKQAGTLIYELLQDSILTNESFEYIVCNKAILQCNYEKTRLRQKYILFNTFSYLSNVTINNCDDKKFTTTISIESSSVSSNNVKKPSLLMKVLLTIAECWSNKTKILFRTHAHNRYISFAFIIAFRHALDYDKNCLLEHCVEIQSMIMQGFTVYLDRASIEQRNLAMCLGEILLPKLHQLIDSNVKLSQDDQKKSLSSNELKFDVDWDDDCLEMKNLFYSRIEELFYDCLNTKEESFSANSGTLETKSLENFVERREKQLIINDLNVSFKDLMKERGTLEESKKKAKPPTKPKKIILLDENNDEDDLLPYDNDNDDEKVSSISGVKISSEDITKIPIYLRDCIDGLMENKDPNYVKLCLIKVTDLIQELSSQELVKSVDKYKISLNKQSSTDNNSEVNINDAISDIAIEMSKILLYLDDQYNIEGFSGLRMKAMISLAISAPSLVVKCLLDEFNGDNRNMRHQLDILQVLVSSAQNLCQPIETKTTDINVVPQSSSSLSTTAITKCYQSKTRITSARASLNLSSRIVERTNGFAKYASLYFYGIVHRLKISLGGINNSTILFVDRQWLDTDRDDNSELTKINISNKKKIMLNINRNNYDKGLDDSYMLSRILFSISLIMKCLNQQPITCKLSNDLLDILAAYKCHRDIGVRRAIINCLTVIRDCTPGVYFEEYLYSKIENLFGPFIANECNLIDQLQIK